MLAIAIYLSYLRFLDVLCIASHIGYIKHTLSFDFGNAFTKFLIRLLLHLQQNLRC